MPKLERWVIASKMVPVLDHETLGELVALGASIGGGWSQVHQHINVNSDNKEQVEKLLLSRGYDVSTPGDEYMLHPDLISHIQKDRR